MTCLSRYGCATARHNVSLSWWDQDDANDIVGEHVVVTNGYDRMVIGLANYLEVLTEREVSRMGHGAHRADGALGASDGV